MPLADHYGCVADAETQKPLEGIIIRLVPKDSAHVAPKPDITRIDGTFRFSQIDDTQEWTLVCLTKKGTTTLDQKVDLSNGKSTASPAIYSLVFTTKIVNQKAGLAFLVVLVLILAGMIGYWLNSAEGPVLTRSTEMLEASAKLESLASRETTLISSSPIGERLNALKNAIPTIESPPKLAETLNAAVHELAAMELLRQTHTTRTDLVLDSLSNLSDPRLPDKWSARIEAVRSAHQAVKNLDSEADELGTALSALKSSANELYAASAEAPGVNGYLAVLASTVSALTDELSPTDRIASEKSVFFERLAIIQGHTNEVAVLDVREKAYMTSTLFDWRIGSSLVWTVLFWGVAGSVVRLIMVIQKYLFFGSFYQRGFYQHIGLFFTVPLLAASFVKLASMVTIQANTSDFQLNFADPQIMAVAAFLLALSPWQLWERLLSISDGVSGKTH